MEKRRTYRDCSDREVSDEILKRVIGAAFKAPTNSSSVCLRWDIRQKTPFFPNKKKSTSMSGYIRISGNAAT